MARSLIDRSFLSTARCVLCQQRDNEWEGPPRPDLPACSTLDAWPSGMSVSTTANTYQSGQDSTQMAEPSAVDIQRNTGPLTSHSAHRCLPRRRSSPRFKLAWQLLQDVGFARDRINNPGLLGTVVHLASKGWNLLAGLPYRWEKCRVSDRQHHLTGPAEFQIPRSVSLGVPTQAQNGWITSIQSCTPKIPR
ncbi:hypothetical protein P170DRAFT_506746 [Aspergillus steynii IBT 23096]|uniref:Uncharacterized protein n=1 Tax=Aspergillus steynii IBT 23096 TaxID=1392250 RepID=A0A2I2GG08_9EURO|nr:uncharacterized protein P170DRAFT_506746 [Aspergillus steynii IBT 23096]PLB51818.1 hypothetical protein P170DRAFT_506746 [Aspergillus steynii IBT 23096]